MNLLSKVLLQISTSERHQKIFFFIMFSERSLNVNDVAKCISIRSNNYAKYIENVFRLQITNYFLICTKLQSVINWVFLSMTLQHWLYEKTRYRISDRDTEDAHRKATDAKWVYDTMSETSVKRWIMIKMKSKIIGSIYRVSLYKSK